MFSRYWYRDLLSFSLLKLFKRKTGFFWGFLHYFLVKSVFSKTQIFPTVK